MTPETLVSLLTALRPFARVHPYFLERASAVEDRLIKLIDGGEDLADWYPQPDLRSVIREC